MAERNVSAAGIIDQDGYLVDELTVRDLRRIVCDDIVLCTY